MAFGSIIYLESLDVDFGRENGGLDKLDKIALKQPASVTVVPFKATPRVCFIREFGPGIEDPVLKFLTGRIDAAEDARAAAGRELIEETGWQASSLTSLGWL